MQNQLNENNNNINKEIISKQLNDAIIALKNISHTLRTLQTTQSLNSKNNSNLQDTEVDDDIYPLKIEIINDNINGNIDLPLPK